MHLVLLGRSGDLVITIGVKAATTHDAPPGFAKWPKNQASGSSPRNLRIDCTVCCSVSNRSRGLRDSIDLISVRATPSGL